MNRPSLRIGLVVIVLALAGTGVWLGPIGPDTPPAPGSIVSPPYRLCPVAEAGGGFASRLGIYRDGGGEGRLSVVGGSGKAGMFVFSDTFTFQTDVGELAERGVTPLLIESDASAATYNRAGGAAAVAACVSASANPVAVLGMATDGGESSTLILANPFAVEASVQLEAVSEFGIDTPTDLEQVRIPAATSLELDFDQALAGRESLSFVITTVSGTVVAGMRRAGENDLAATEAIAGATEWYFALPDFGADGSIQVRPLAEGDTAFRIDRIGTDVLAEAVAEGTIDSQAEAIFPLADLDPDAGGYVLSSDQPVAAALVYTGADVRAVSPGAERAANSWIVPVSALRTEGQTAFWLLNATDRDLTANITSLDEGGVRTVRLPPGETTGTVVQNLQGSSALVTADGPIVVFYGVVSGSAVGMSVATPLE